MKCPECNTDMGVLDSRKRKDNRTIRRYACPKCSRRFTSTELLEGSHKYNYATGLFFLKVTRSLAAKYVKNNGWVSKLTGKTYATRADAVEDTYQFLKGMADLHETIETEETNE